MVILLEIVVQNRFVVNMQYMDRGVIVIEDCLKAVKHDFSLSVLSILQICLSQAVIRLCTIGCCSLSGHTLETDYI